MGKPYRESLQERLDREYAWAGGYNEFVQQMGNRPEEIATHFKVSYMTVHRWKKQYQTMKRKMDALS